MKYNYTQITLLASMLLLGGCGGSGDTTFEKSTIAVIHCDGSGGGLDDCGASGLDYYTCVQSNDTLTASSAGTTIKAIYDSNNDKKVCVVSGAAYIIKGS